MDFVASRSVIGNINGLVKSSETGEFLFSLADLSAVHVSAPIVVL
jgi:hypothetical protein